MDKLVLNKRDNWYVEIKHYEIGKYVIGLEYNNIISTVLKSFQANNEPISIVNEIFDELMYMIEDVDKITGTNILRVKLRPLTIAPLSKDIIKNIKNNNMTYGCSIEVKGKTIDCYTSEGKPNNNIGSNGDICFEINNDGLEFMNKRLQLYKLVDKHTLMFNHVIEEFEKKGYNIDDNFSFLLYIILITVRGLNNEKAN